MSQKVLLALSPVLVEKVAYIAVQEQRTRSELFREALRRYIENFEEKKGVIKTKYDGELKVD